MNYYIGSIKCSSELYHHGIKGQKWGVRRFQNPDGTRTAAGKERYSSYGKASYKEISTDRKNYQDQLRKELDKKYKVQEAYDDFYKFLDDHPHLDQDDGGGGTNEEAEEFWRLSEEIDKRETARDIEVGKKTSEYLVNKYSEKRMAEVKRSDNIRTATAVVGALLLSAGILVTAPITIPLALAAIMVHSKIKQKKREKDRAEYQRD